MCMHIYVYVGLCVCVYVGYVDVGRCICVYVHVCMFMCVCLYVYVCMCVCVYMGMCGFNLDRQNCMCARASAFYFFTFIMMEVWYNLDGLLFIFILSIYLP